MYYKVREVTYLFYDSLPIKKLGLTHIYTYSNKLQYSQRNNILDCLMFLDLFDLFCLVRYIFVKELLDVNSSAAFCGTCPAN